MSKSTPTNFGIYRPGQNPSTKSQSDLIVDDASLNNFVRTLDNYVPSIPDSTTTYFLNTSGFETSDDRIKRLVSITATKFISDILDNALNYAQDRTSVENVENPEQNQPLTLKIDDLKYALEEFGITTFPFYTKK